MMRGSIAVFCLITITTISAWSQRIDSLQTVLDTATAERKVKTYNELFRFYSQSDPVKAIGFTREALHLAIEINDRKGIAASYNNLGVAYRNQGALDKALEYYIRSLKIYEELENKEGIATLKNNIANIYSMKKDYGQAMRYLEESYNLFIQLNDKPRIIGSMNNLGNLNLDLQRYEKAMKNYSEAYQLSQQSGLKFSDPVHNMGNIYFRQGNYQKAIDSYLRALAMERESNDKIGVLGVTTNIGIAYARSGQPALAQRYLSEAEDLVKEMQAYAYLPPILKHNAELYYKQGNAKAAYETFLQYDSLREKIFGEESTRKIAQMELVLDFQEQEKAMEIEQKEHEITKLQLKTTRLYIVLAILAILMVMGVINLYFMGNKRKLINPRA